jgi:hypothetical protein
MHASHVEFGVQRLYLPDANLASHFNPPRVPASRHEFLSKTASLRCQQWCREGGKSAHYGAIQSASHCIGLHQFAPKMLGSGSPQVATRVEFVQESRLASTTYKSGGHGGRTRNRLPGITFPV